MRLHRQTRPESLVRTTPAGHDENADTQLGSVEGTIQRINYRDRELTVIADGRPWHFALSAESQMWFNGRLAPFRCFQPLDHVRVYYECRASGRVAEALYVWAAEGASESREPPI
jgi:hypothetical protein